MGRLVTARSSNLRYAGGVILSFMCALCACATYRSAPLEPAKSVHRFVQRSLADPRLCAYVKANSTAGIASCPSAEWNLTTLTLAGFFYSPALAVADAQVGVARAAIVTAGQRPNPSVGLGPAYAATAFPNFAPWGLGVAELNFPIETAGKRGYRIAQAQRQAVAAEIGVDETAWRIRGAIRDALLAHLVARRAFALARAYQSASARVAQALQERVAAGAAAAPALNFALANLSTARLKTAQARSRVSETLNSLAAAIGLPVDALQDVGFVWPGFERPPDEASLTAARLRELALLNRLDLRRMLEQYAAADEALKLEIARQYPDINLGGGYSWEVNENIFELIPIVNLPVMNQNQGPIAEARARRAQIAAEFTALQYGIISQTQGALTQYRGALEAYAEGSNSAAFAEQRLAATRRARQLGDLDSLTLATAQLQTIVAEQSRLAALANAQAALGALEDAVARPLLNGDLQAFKLPASLPNQAEDQTRQ